MVLKVGSGRRPRQVAYPVELSCEDAGPYARSHPYRYHRASVVHMMDRRVNYGDEPFVRHVWQMRHMNTPQLEATNVSVLLIALARQRRAAKPKC